MNAEESVLYTWLVSLSKFYTIINKEVKLSHFIAEYITDENFIHKFFISHFLKIADINCTNKLEMIKLNLTKYFDLFSFPHSSTRQLINKTCDSSNKLSIIKIWKLFLTLTFLEEYTYSKYIKIDENICNMTNNSFMGFYQII